MPSRTTAADVRRALERVTPDLLAHLPAGATLHLQQGSPTYGNAWRLHYCPAGSYGRHSIPGGPSDGYLGWSAREAEMSLVALAWGLSLARSAS